MFANNFNMLPHQHNRFRYKYKHVLGFGVLINAEHIRHNRKWQKKPSHPHCWIESTQRMVKIGLAFNYIALWMKWEKQPDDFDNDYRYGSTMENVSMEFRKKDIHSEAQTFSFKPIKPRPWICIQSLKWRRGGTVVVHGPVDQWVSS